MLPPCLRARRSSAARRSSTRSSDTASPSPSASDCEPWPAARSPVVAQLAGEIPRLDRRGRASARRARRAPGRRRRAPPAARRRPPSCARRRAPAAIRAARASAAGAGGRAQRVELAQALARRRAGARARARRAPARRSRRARSRAGRARARALGPSSSELSQALLQACACGRRPARRRASAPACCAPQRPSRICSWHAGERQPAVLVLPVEGQQRAAERRAGRRPWPSGRRGTRACGRPRPRAARARSPGVRAGRQGSPSSFAQRLGQVEDALDVGLAGARPHDPGPRPAAEQQVERVGEHGLARAGLACEHVQPRRETQVGPLDEQQVLDVQLVQHRAGVAADADGSAARGRARRNARLRPDTLPAPLPRYVRKAYCVWSFQGWTPKRRVHLSATRHGCQRPKSARSAASRRAALNRLSESALLDRLEEEIGRAERHGTKLSCLLVVIDNVEELVREHGSELPSRRSPTWRARCGASCAASTASAGRATGELLIVLPGADGPRARSWPVACSSGCSTIKVEADGTRRPLQISLGLAAWRADMSAPRSCSPAPAPPRAGATATILRRPSAASRRRGRGGRPTLPALLCGPRRRSKAPRLHNRQRCSPDQSCGCCA